MEGESKMSLGYVKGKYWVADDVYARYTEWESYKKLIRACSDAGFFFRAEYSYNARRYTADVLSLHKHPNGRYSYVPHANAYHENPMIALALAIRKHPHESPLVAALCLELEVLILREKLLQQIAEDQKLEDRLDQVLDSLASTIRKIA